MSKTFIVSSHGGCIAGQNFFVPDGVTLHFYCAKGTVLTYNEAVRVLGALNKNQAPTPAWSVHGDSVKLKDINAKRENFAPNFYCWDLKDKTYSSGLFRAKTGERLIDLGNVKEDKPVFLRDMLELLRGGKEDKEKVVHCLFCTDVTARNTRTIDNTIPTQPAMASSATVDQQYKRD